MSETWKPIRGYEGYYEVSDLGRVRSLDRKDSMGRVCDGQSIRAMPTRRGYQTVGLHQHGQRRHRLVHRLVAEAFAPISGKRLQVNHINGDKVDNRASNLEWCTASENIRHAHATGLHAGKPKAMNPTQVRIAKRCREIGVPIIQIARTFALSRATIRTATDDPNYHKPNRSSTQIATKPLVQPSDAG